MQVLVLKYIVGQVGLNQGEICQGGLKVGFTVLQCLEENISAAKSTHRIIYANQYIIQGNASATATIYYRFLIVRVYYFKYIFIHNHI